MALCRQLLPVVWLAFLIAGGGPAPGQAPRTDQYGDPLPPGALARLGTTRLRQTDPIRCLALSPDGTLAASAGTYGGQVWETATGRQRSSWSSGEETVQALAFSPDGRTLAERRRTDATGKTVISLRDVATGDERHSLTPADMTSALAFAPDGRTLASASTVGELALWDVAGGQKRRTLRSRPLTGRSLAFTPDGKELACGGEEGSVGVWDLEAGKERWWVKGHNGTVTALAFSPDGRTLASSGNDDRIRFWDRATGRALRSVRVERNWSRQIVFAADGKTLWGQAGDSTLRCWEVATGSEVGRWQDVRSDITQLAFSADGKQAALTGAPGGMVVRLVDLAAGKERQREHLPGHEGAVSSVAFAPDGKLLASSSVEHSDPVIYLWDPASGRVVRELRGHRGGVHAVAFSPDGKLLASGGDDMTVRLWDAGTGQTVRVLATEGSVATCVAFAPDGRVLATAEKGSVLALTRAVVWDVETGKQLGRFPGVGAGSVRSLAFSPDGSVLALTGSRFVLWNLRRATQVGTWGRQEARESTRVVAFSPDGRFLAAAHAQGAIVLYEAKTGTEVARLKGNSGGVTDLAFSPDGSLLAWAGSDMTTPMRIWDTFTGDAVIHFPRLGHMPRSVAFAPDGKTLVAGEANGTLLIWGVSGRRTRPAAATGGDVDPATLDELRLRLGSGNAAEAYPAMRTLAAAPRPALPLLKRVLQRPAGLTAEQLARLIRDLDDDAFEVREKASAALAQGGEAAARALRKALASAPPPEVRRRADAVLELLESSQVLPANLPQLRAVHVLERIASPEAKKLLQEVAGRPGEGDAEQHARAALKRLGGTR
jgi:WD40 repeat protein